METSEITVVQIPNDLHEKLKYRGLELKKTLKDLVKEIITDYFSKAGE